MKKIILLSACMISLIGANNSQAAAAGELPLLELNEAPRVSRPVVSTETSPPRSDKAKSRKRSSGKSPIRSPKGPTGLTGMSAADALESLEDL